MTMKYKNVKVFWDDAKLYHSLEKRDSLTPTICQGKLIKNTKNFVVLKNCQQKMYNKEKKKYVFKRKAYFFFIPKGMIKKIEWL